MKAAWECTARHAHSAHAPHRHEKARGMKPIRFGENLHDAITSLRCLSVQSLLLAFVLRIIMTSVAACPASGKNFPDDVDNLAMPALRASRFEVDT